MNRLPLLAAVCAASAACSSEGPRGLEPTITDSAGVAIVTAPSLVTLPSRALTGPILDLATSQDSAEASFSGVSSVLRLADGRVVVADGASRRLKVFGPDGSYRRTLGGSQADGAGLSAITAMWAIDGNRIAAFDRRHRTVYTVSLDGGSVDAAPLAMTPANPRAVGRLASGHVLMRTLVRNTPEIGFEVSEVAITRWREDGSLVDTVGIWPSARMGLLGQPPVQLVSSPMFEPRLIGAAAGDRLLVSDCRTGQYMVIDPEVGLERLVRWPATQDSVTDDDVAAFRARRLGALSPEQQVQIRSYLDDMPVNETMPACDQLRISSDGSAWVRAFVRPSAAMQRWLVFDPAGRPQFGVEFPVTARLVDVGSDYIVVIERRPLDVARIRVYGIE
jgi:hypothetical protein